MARQKILDPDRTRRAICVSQNSRNSNQTMKSSKSRRRCQSVLSYQGMSPKSGMVRRIALRSRSTWQPDETAEYCAKCERKFTGWITSGKHHCRRCGRIFCSSCCNLFVTLPDDWRAHSIASKSWGIIPSLTYQKKTIGYAPIVLIIFRWYKKTHVFSCIYKYCDFVW